MADTQQHSKSWFWIWSSLAVSIYLFVLPAVLFPVCSAVVHEDQIFPGRFTIDGQQGETGIQQTGKASGKSIVPPPITQSQVVVEHGAQGTHYPAREPPHTWWIGTLCEINLSDYLIGFFTLILAISTIGLWSQTKRLAEGAVDQSEKMVRSIAQATRAANAMESVSQSVAKSAASAAESVAALKERTAAQMRAYLTVLVSGGIYQERRKDQSILHFEARPALVNAGHTPARKLSYWANADILPVPLPSTYKLPEPQDKKIHSVVLGPHQNFVLNAVVHQVVDDSEVAIIKAGLGRAVYVWGRVTYEDVFGEPHFTDFCHHIFWMQGKDAEIITGYYTEGRNDAD